MRTIRMQLDIMYSARVKVLVAMCMYPAQFVRHFLIKILAAL